MREKHRRDRRAFLAKWDSLNLKVPLLTTGFKFGRGFVVVEWATGGMNEMYVTLSDQMKRFVSVPSRAERGMMKWRR